MSLCLVIPSSQSSSSLTHQQHFGTPDKPLPPFHQAGGGHHLHSPSCPPDLHGSIAGSLSSPDLYTLQRPVPQTLNISSPCLLTWVLLIPLNTTYTLMTSKGRAPASLCPQLQTCSSGWMVNKLLKQASPQQSLVFHIRENLSFLHLPIVPGA